MFNLERSICDWRKQMLDAGIKAPVPLDELESHLREAIEQQMKSGMNEAEAFKTAVQKIGLSFLLKSEFAKTSGFLSWFNDNKFINTMKRKIGVSAVVATLLLAVVLQFSGAPLVARISKVSHQFNNGQWWTSVDNF